MATARNRIVAVDDDEMVLELVSVTLERWAHAHQVEVVTCRSGAEALALLEQDAGTVSVILSDLRMPGMKGTELLRTVMERYPGIITILVTGYADVRDIAEAVQSGIFSFLLKPWKREYLEAELDKALRVRALREENTRFLTVMEEELRWAGELQRAIFSLDLPSSTHATFDVTYLPLQQFQCGGDYYDVFDAGTERSMFMIGDVAGHGVKAAFMTFFLKAAIRQGYLPTAPTPTPAGLLGWLNRLICRELAELPNLLVTFCVCLLDSTSCTLTYASAGHLPIHVVRGGQAIPLRAAGMGIGFQPDSTYSDHSFTVTAGDRIVLHTDGLRELGPELTIDDDRFACILASAAGQPAYEASVLGAVRAQAGGVPFTDDVTLLSAQVF